MKFLVTGATGFAGPHLIDKLLAHGHVRVVVADLLERGSLDRVFSEEFDGVFHLGAFSHPSSSFDTPMLAMETNALGTAKICDEILQKMPKCILMQCSTPEVYGICPSDSKIKEDTPLRPNNPYAVGKAAADLYVLERAQSAGLRVFLTRAFSHTGPRRRSNFSISSDAIQIAKILKGQQERVIKIGNMESQRIVADVRDVTDVYYRLMMKFAVGCVPSGEVYHIAGNELHTMQYYLDLMLEMYGLTDVDQEIEPAFFRKVDIPIQIPDDSKVREFLGWEPSIPIEQTLRDLVEYWMGRI